MTPQDTERIKQAAEEKHPEYTIFDFDSTDKLDAANLGREIAMDSYKDGATAEAQHWAPIVESLEDEKEDLEILLSAAKSALADRDKTISSLKDDVEELVKGLKAAILVKDLWSADQYDTVGADKEGEMIALNKMERSFEQLIAKHK